ncbi:MAG: PAS domain S-box protein [Nitriliruptoraceae bacterium]
MTDRGTRTRFAEHQRLEALRRLGPLDAGGRRQLAPVLHVLAAAIGAELVAVTLIDAEYAWDVASTREEPAPVRPRVGSIAGRVVTTAAPVSQLVEDGSLSADEQPQLLAGAHLDEVPRPARWSAVPIRTPDGEVVGALEAAWHDRAATGRSVWQRLEDAGRHVEHVLELHAEVAEYRRFVELAPDAVLVLDADGDVELTNPALCEVLGYEHPEDLDGRAFVELVAPTDRARVASTLARVLFARRRTVHLDVELLATDGRAVPCSISAGHLRGPRRHLQLVVHDLTERLRDEEERSRLSEQLARAQRPDAVGQVASGLAHDLNNLLVVMTSNLALAEESLDELGGRLAPPVLEPIQRDLTELRTAVTRAEGLTSKLLQFVRDEEAEHGSADVVEVVDAVRGLAGRSLGDEMTLNVDLPAALPPVAADPIEFERALLNLVLNARDALEAGGTITLAATTVGDDVEGATPRGDDGDGIERGRQWVRIDVLDDGVGMDEVTRARAFEPLWSSKGPEAGTGLGLATVAAFVDAVDGSVAIDAEPDEGTRVVLHLPVDDGAFDAVPVGVDVPVAGARVVLIEPGERTRQVIVRMLRAVGYRVRAFGGADEALEALREEGAELLITELSLPGTSGSGMVPTARALLPGLKVVVLASVDGPRTLEGVPLLVKPFSHQRLLRTVREVLAG